jgi:hypothetical protein
VTLTFRYKLTVVSLRADRNAQALASVDGVQYGVPPNNYIYRYDGVTGGLNTNTGWQTVTINLGTLSAGTHNLALGAYLSRKSATIETAEIIVDDVQVTTQQ